MTGMDRLCLGLALLLLNVSTAVAQVPVTMVEPGPGTPLFDQVDLEVRLGTGAEEVERVEFFVDDRKVGTATSAPWRVSTDVGSENRDRRVVAVAYGSRTEVGRAERIAAAIPVHETVDLELQQLFVTVTGRDGQRVVDLDRSAFSIRDDGKRQEIVTVAGGEIPFTAALILDGSRSMAGPPLAAALAGTRRFVEGMAENDEAKVLVTSDRVLASSPWTDSGAVLSETLDATRATGGSAILDHLFLGLQLLEDRLGRRVLILLSDGWDLHSALTEEQVRQVARRSQAMVYWVRMGSEGPGPRGPSRHAHSWVEGGGGNEAQRTVAVPLSVWRDREGWQSIVHRLEQIVEDSGGRIVAIQNLGQIEAAFADILQELREQVALGYYPNPRRNDGSWRDVKVRAEGRGLKLRTRKGYIDRE